MNTHRFCGFASSTKTRKVVVAVALAAILAGVTLLTLCLVLGMGIDETTLITTHERSGTPKPTNIEGAYLLKNTSLWAAGADSRMTMVKYDRIPIVTWTEEAEQTILSRWQAVQHDRAACDGVAWFYPWGWGMTSQLRDYSDLAIISVFTFGRALLPRMDVGRRHPIPQWCGDAVWFACYFQPFAGQQCKDVVPEGPWVGRDDLKELGNASKPFLQITRRTRGWFLLYDHTLFPNDMWDALVTNQSVLFKDAQSQVVMPLADVLDLKRVEPTLYYHLSLSALRAIMARHIFKVRPEIEKKAEDLLQDLPVGEPTVALHIRRTDKKLDKGVTDSLSFNNNHVRLALDTLTLQVAKHDRTSSNTTSLYQTLLALSDDPRAITELQEELGNETFKVKGLSNVKNFLSDADYAAYLQQGHSFMEGREILDKDPQAVYDYYASVVVDVVAASNNSDYLVGMGSSGVSQWIAQRIGGRRRIEGNALSLWQEDL